MNGSVRLAAGVMLGAAALQAGCGFEARSVRYSRWNEATQVVEQLWMRDIRGMNQISTLGPDEYFKPEERAAAAYDSDNHRIVIGTGQGGLHLLDARTGHTVWTRTFEDRIESQPLIANGLIYAGGHDGMMHALDMGGGSLWSYDARGVILEHPVERHGVLFFTTDQNRVYALDAKTGKWLWHYDRELPPGFTIRGAPAPCVTDQAVFVGFADGYLCALTPEDGSLQWCKSLSTPGDFAGVFTNPIIYRNVLYVSAYREGLFALKPGDGSLLWMHPGPAVGQFAFGSGMVFFGSNDNRVHALDLSKGEEAWRYKFNEGYANAVTYFNGYLAVPVDRKYLFLLNARTGSLVQAIQPGYGITAPAARLGNMLFFLSNLGYLHAFKVLVS